jgi:hypothetical protein
MFKNRVVKESISFRGELRTGAALDIGYGGLPEMFRELFQKIDNIDEIVFWDYLDSPPKVYDEFEIKFKWGKSLNRSKIAIIMQSIGISQSMLWGMDPSWGSPVISAKIHPPYGKLFWRFVQEYSSAESWIRSLKPGDI